AELGVPTTSSPLKNLVLDIDYNDAVVVIHTSPGAAQLIARLLRDEVADLEAAGIGIIQIDEPALREGLPLRRSDWDAYLEWGV
ncbi:hypothetical protein MJN76_34740, partial [Salmonella enterica subsp. enterica serovar Anatum]|nr:hypothetical protein [Salmonella enterica subsp. enterica serovar Anatum]